MSSSEQDFVLVEQPELNLKLSKISAWLHPTDYASASSDFIKHLNSHVPGTGEWLEKIPQYRQWHGSTTHGSLWLKAVAGAGKSVLAARLISHLQITEPETPVIFFFFRQIIASNHDPHSLVRDWMAQFLGHSAHLRTMLDRLREEGRHARDVAFSELWQILLESLDSVDKTYCVVDALDELDSEYTLGFLQRLVALGEARPNAIKLLMTSRPLPQVQKVLNVSSVLQVRLEDRQVNKDIGIFVHHRLARAQHLSESSRETIRRSVEDRVYPSFLYARLVINELLDEHKGDSLVVATVQNSLVSLPSSMEDMYSEMLYDHSQLASIPQERQLIILQLATHASRPLRLLEIATVLHFLDMNNDARKHGDTKNLTRLSCGPLLEILDDETVATIHHSFTEFLTDTSRKNRPVTERANHRFPVIETVQTHELMALLCVKYLLAGCLSSWELEETRRRPYSDRLTFQHKRLQLQHPFFRYAVENWYHHARRLPVINGELLEQLNTFINAGNASFHAWIDAVIRPEYSVPSVSPLHVAAWAGTTSYVKHLLATGHEVDLVTGNKETPLTLAAQKGHPDIVAVLLHHGAAADEPDIYGHKPLHYAAQSNHYSTAQVLLDAGVSPLTGKTCDYPPPMCGNARSGVGDSPLRYASLARCLESVRSMLPHLTEKDIHSSFCWAVESGSLALVEFLIENASVDAGGEVGESCLLQAAGRLDWDMMQLLIRSGAVPAFERRGKGGSLLYAICTSKDGRYLPAARISILEKCLGLALDTGCDINFKGAMGYTALHHCVRSGLPVVEKLLQHGADVHATDDDGNTPLHLLKPFAKAVPIVEALVRHGARWDVIREKDGKTPLHTCCASFLSGPDIECLRPYVKNWNVPDADGNTPLHLSTMSKQLISMGADVNWKNHAGQTPLHKSKLRSIASNPADLLAAGADIEARDNKGRTWFLHTVCNGSFSANVSLQEILDLGADLHAVDYARNGALHLVCKASRSKGRVDFLLKAGASPRHVNSDGDTVYHVLIKHCFDSDPRDFQPELDLLLSTDAPIMAKNHRGETLLHSACGSGVSDVNSALRDEAWNPIDSFPRSDVDEMLKMEDNEGKLPIHVAAATSEEWVAWCIGKGSDLTARTHKRQNLLHLAASADQSNTIGLLLETCGKAELTQSIINQQDASGWTPLHNACASGRTESVKLLLEAGADVKVAAGREGWTPLHACAEFSKKHGASGDRWPRPIREVGITSEEETLRVTDIIRLLHQYGANIMAKSDYGLTPMQLAVDRGAEEMVAALMQIAHKQPQTDVARGCSRAGLLYLARRHTHAGSVADELLQSNIGPRDLMYDCVQLLKLGAYDVLEELARRGYGFRTMLSGSGGLKKLYRCL